MEINVIGGALYTQDGKKIADVKDSSIMLVDEPYKQRTMEVALLSTLRLSHLYFSRKT